MDVAILISVKRVNVIIISIIYQPTKKTKLKQFFKLMCDSGIKIIVVYVTCHQRYQH